LALNSRRLLLGSSGPDCGNLIPLFAKLFSGTLLRQSLLHPASLARLQVVRVTLHFLDDVFRHNLALEPLCNNGINRPDNSASKPDGCSAPTRVRWNLSIWRTTWTSSRSASIAEPAKVSASYFIGSCNRQ
jgi:hypothetical protein